MSAGWYEHLDWDVFEARLERCANFGRSLQFEYTWAELWITFSDFKRFGPIICGLKSPKIYIAQLHHVSVDLKEFEKLAIALVVFQPEIAQIELVHPARQSTFSYQIWNCSKKSPMRSRVLRNSKTAILVHILEIPQSWKMFEIVYFEWGMPRDFPWDLKTFLELQDFNRNLSIDKSFLVIVRKTIWFLM